MCNMACPWCIALRDRERDKRRPVALWTEEVREAFFQHISTVPYKGFAFLGGEPLLFPEELLGALRRIRQEISKDKPLAVYTNASLLTPALAEEFNVLGVQIVLSVNYVGPKGLDNLIAHAPYGAELVNIIRSVKQRSLRVVFLRKAPFALEAILLHAIFDCMVSVRPDFTTLGEWDDSDIAHVERELALMDRIAPEHGFVSMQLIGTERCDCREAPDTLYGDGVRRPSVFSSPHCIYGCAAARDRMGDVLFNRYIVTVMNHSSPFYREKSPCPL